MENKHKEFIVPLLVVVIVILIAGSIYLYLQNKKSQNSANNTNTVLISQGDVLPTKVGQCAITKVAKVENRLRGENGPFISGSGSVIRYTDGGLQVSYDQISAIDNSIPGDQVKLCLESMPENCPSGDERGKVYSALNLRTNKSWQAPDSEHSCGGA